MEIEEDDARKGYARPFSGMPFNAPGRALTAIEGKEGLGIGSGGCAQVSAFSRALDGLIMAIEDCGKPRIEMSVDR